MKQVELVNGLLLHQRASNFKFSLPNILLSSSSHHMKCIMYFYSFFPPLMCNTTTTTTTTRPVWNAWDMFCLTLEAGNICCCCCFFSVLEKYIHKININILCISCRQQVLDDGDGCYVFVFKLMKNNKKGIVNKTNNIKKTVNLATIVKRVK